MLRSDFELFSGIGPATVLKLHNAGYFSWNDVLSAPEKLPMGRKRRESFVLEIERAIEQYSKKNLLPLVELIKPKATWTLFS